MSRELAAGSEPPPLRSRYCSLSSRSRSLGTLLLFGASVTCVGCKERDTAQQAPTPARVVPATPEPVGLGEIARNAYFELVVSDARPCRTEPPFAPAAGFERLGVSVKIQGLSTLDVPVNPFYAALRDASGQRFEATLAGCTPALRAGRVTQGEQTEGWVSFDVPQSRGALEFRYEPLLIGVGRITTLHRLDL